MQLKFATLAVLASLAVFPVLSQPIDSGLVSQYPEQSYPLDKPPRFNFGRFLSGLSEMFGLRRGYGDLAGKLEARGFFSQPKLVTREIPVEYVARDLEDELEAREFDDVNYWSNFVTQKVARRDLNSDEDYWSNFVLHELGKREQEEMVERELYEDGDQW